MNNNYFTSEEQKWIESTPLSLLTEVDLLKYGPQIKDMFHKRPTHAYQPSQIEDRLRSAEYALSSALDEINDAQDDLDKISELLELD